MLDTAQSLETPEGADIQLHIAGIPVRGMALLLDEAIRWGVLIAASIVLGVMGKLGMGLFLLLIFLLYWFYGVVFEVFNHGQTPGKRAMGIAVVNRDGTPVRFPASLVRNLLLAVDMLPLFYMLGMLSMAFSKRFARLGDLLADTQVVYRAPTKPIRLPEVQGAAALPLPMTLEEQQAVLSFAERSTALSAPRVQELANLLADVLGAKDQLAVTRLQRIANGLRGQA